MSLDRRGLKGVTDNEKILVGRSDVKRTNEKRPGRQHMEIDVIFNFLEIVGGKET